MVVMMCKRVFSSHRKNQDPAGWLSQFHALQPVTPLRRYRGLRLTQLHRRQHRRVMLDGGSAGRRTECLRCAASGSARFCA